MQFTGQRLDATGLYYYGARYYDASMGRFISPDTIIPNPANPQSLNRYTYCSNNPLKYIDPSGLTDVTYTQTELADEQKALAALFGVDISTLYTIVSSEGTETTVCGNSGDTVGVDSIVIPMAVLSGGNYIRQQERDTDLNIISTEKIGGGYSYTFLFHFTYNKGETGFSSLRSWGIYGYFGSDEDFNNTLYQMLYSSEGPEPLTFVITHAITQSAKLFAGFGLMSLPSLSFVPPFSSTLPVIQWFVWGIGGVSNAANFLGYGPWEVGCRWVTEISQTWDADNPGILVVQNF